jgi:protein-disulfide isomerase
MRELIELSHPVSFLDHVRGAASPKVTLLEYGDFECPFCARAEPVVREIEAYFGGDLQFAFRHNPRAFDHPHARQAAEAAEAAAEQGRFWEMHDMLFAHQSALEYGHLLEYARTLGLDMDRFDAALRTSAHRERVRMDELSGVQSHVISTPGFFINRVRFQDTPDFERLSAAIELAYEDEVAS